ncbi:TPA: transporter substrate-binding domain-containing protein [Serratia odorifera]
MLRITGRWLIPWLALLLPFFAGSEPLFGAGAEQILPEGGRPVALYSTIAEDSGLLPAQGAQTLPQYRRLTVGVLCCNGAPLVSQRWDGKLEGIYPDYLRLLQQVLQRPVEVRQFSSWTQANRALQQGRIQLVAQPSSQSGSSESQSYPILVQPFALIVRNANLSKPPAEMDIMAAPDINPADIAQLRTHYRRVEVAESRQVAVQAVADNKSDAYLDGQSQIAYLAAFRPVSGLVYRRELTMGAQFYGFSGRPADGVVSGINAILTAIPHTVKNEIYERWVSGLALGNSSDALRFSAEEKNWVRQHPVVNVALNSNTPPFAFFDKNHEITGLDVDILRLLGDKSGIYFNFIPANGLAAVQELLKAGKAQMTPSLVATSERRQWLDFSQSFGTIEWVMITRNERSAPSSLAQLKQRRIAILRDHALLSAMKQYPDIAVVQVDNMEQAIDMVLAGAVDATFDNLASANYQQVSRYGAKISIRSLNDSLQPEQYAVSTRYPQLHDILNKSIEALPPTELRVLRLRWLSVANLATDGDERMSPWGLMWVGALFIIALSSIFWGSYLTHQVRRRKQAESQQQDLRSYWETLFNNMPTPMFVCDPSMRITAANLYFRREWEQAAEVVGQTLPELRFLSAEDERELSLIFLRCLAGEPAYFSDRRIAIRGQHKEVYLWLEGYSNTDGVIQGIIGGWFDVTERKLLARELCHERDKAENASLEKSAFLARMSHEIRTPLHAIIGILDLEVQQRASSPALQIAWQAAMSLQGVIGDILDFSRIESGRMTLNPQPASLAVTLEHCAATFSQRAAEKGLCFERRLTLPAGVNHELDVTAISQIINNLLSNAIKFTEQGSVELCADYCTSGDDEQDQVTLTVTDSGCGIAEDMRQAVLQPYVQAAQHNTGQPGTGLGLSISARLAALMGGTLTIAQAPGSGTRVSVVLPLMRSGAPQIQQSKVPTQGEALNVLVVDDSPASRQVLSLQLSGGGHQVTLANSGERALKLMEQDYFDLILTDCQMPQMSGYALTRRLRQFEKQQQLPPLLILGCTANAFSAEREQCLEAGMNGVLVKPLTQQKLLTEIDRYYRQALEDDALCFGEIQALTQSSRSQEIRLLQAVLQGVEEDVGGLRESGLSVRDIAHRAHRLQGAFALLRCQNGVRLCLRIEKGGRSDVQTLTLLLSRADVFRQALLLRLAELDKEET